MHKQIILCADDYGQNAGISQAIIALIAQKRLTATSCMVTSDYWPAAAARLLPYQSDIDVGLHFNLTEGRPLSGMNAMQPVSVWLRKGWLHAINSDQIITELHAQLDQFSQYWGRLPDYLDGHHHVHQFPVIQDCVLKVFQERLANSNAYLRVTNFPLRVPRHEGLLKRLVIRYCGGAMVFARKVKQAKFLSNRSFEGLYDYRQGADVKQIFPHFLARISDRGLIMCHPGADGDVQDEIYQHRLAEYQYLASEGFHDDCERYAVKLARYPR